jgi:hypothetical protein
VFHVLEIHKMGTDFVQVEYWLLSLINPSADRHLRLQTWLLLSFCMLCLSFKPSLMDGKTGAPLGKINRSLCYFNDHF